MRATIYRTAYRDVVILWLVGLVVLAGVPLGLAEDQGIEQLREAAQQGDAKAQYNLGEAYAKPRAGEYPWITKRR